MLDLTQVFQRITQGQPAAEMTPLSAPQAEAADSGGGASAAQGPSASTSAQAHSADAGTTVDARQVADRVYEMLRSDLRILNERRGTW